MAQMFRIDLTSIPTQEERFDIVVLLEKSGFLVSNLYWRQIDERYKTLDYAHAFWAEQSEPVFPHLPDAVGIIEV